MKPKNKIKLHKSVIEAINSSMELLRHENDKLKLRNEELEAEIKNIICGPVDNRKIEDFDFPLAGTSEKDNHFSDSLKNMFYEGGFRSGRTHFYEEWSKQLNEYLKGKGFKNDEPFGMAPIKDKKPKCNHSLTFTCKTGVTTCSFCKEIIKPRKPIAPPLGFNHDFHKQAIEAEKELDKVCNHKPYEILAFYTTCINCGHTSKKINIDLENKYTECLNCYSKFKIEIINNKIIITKIN